MRQLGFSLIVMMSSSTWASAQTTSAAGSIPSANDSVLIDPAACPAPELGLLWRVDLLIGLPTGIRAQHTFAGDDRRAWLAEGFVGLEAIFPSVGGGIRRRYAPCCGKNNALIVSPGLDAYLLINPLSNFDGSFGGGAAIGGLFTADVDLIWQHGFSERWGGELGLKLGVGLGVADSAGILPVASVFAGCRF